MATQNALIQRVLALPEAPTIVAKLNKALEEERERRIHFYEHISEQEKSEFINGEIIVHSPITLDHNLINGNLWVIMDAFVTRHDLGLVGIEKLLIKLTRNDYEPDLCFFKQEKAREFAADQKFFPAPDLIVEVLSDGTEKRDRGVKFEDYQAHGVAEYWLVSPQEKFVEQYLLKDGSYTLQAEATNGQIICQAISGLSVPVKAVFDKKKAHWVAACR